MIHTLFGSINALIKAVYDCKIERFVNELDRRKIDDPVQGAINEGYRLERLDVESVTNSLWSAANGCLWLEIVGFFDDEKAACAPEASYCLIQ